MLWEARYYPKHRVSRGKDHKGKGRRLIAWHAEEGQVWGRLCLEAEWGDLRTKQSR